MSSQTFFKSFLFSNNKEKLKMKHPIATGSTCGNLLAHGHFRPVRSERRGKAAWPGASAHGHLAQLGQGEGHAGAETSRRRGSASGAGGHYRPCQGKRASARGSQRVGECEQAARHGGEGGEGGVPRRPSTVASWPTAAKLGKCATLAQKMAQPRAPSAGERGGAAGT